jgi:hypothetical protein
MSDDNRTHEERLAEGTRIRREVLGAAYVDFRIADKVFREAGGGT